MPTAATIQTDKLMDGDASVQVERRVVPEEAIASPTPHRYLLSVFAHINLLDGGGIVYRRDLAREICSGETPQC
jgi:hypothetical protein